MTRDNSVASADGGGSSPAVGQKDTEDMAKYGIARIPVDYFHVGGFRYTNLSDAVAQAQRRQRPD